MTILEKFTSKTGQIALLIDPEKTNKEDALLKLVACIHESSIDYLFVGGSSASFEDTQKVVSILKNITRIPIVLFPGSYKQIVDGCDAILFLSLLSGRNPEFLIDHHIQSSLILRKIKSEIIPTSYILVDGGTVSAVARISETNPIDRFNYKKLLKTSLAGKFKGNKLTYYEAGSGAIKSIPYSIIINCIKNTSLPIIVGGGINSTKKINLLKKIGVNIIVVGNHVEKNPDFLKEIS